MKDLSNIDLKIKKPAVDLTDLAIGIVILGIVAVIGVNIITNIRDNRLTSLDTVTTHNETLTTSTANNAQLANKWGIGVSEVTNATGGEVISSGNYTVSVSSIDGSLFISNATATYIKPWNVTYSWYNTSRPDWTLPDNAATGLAEYGNWFSILVIVGVASVILALIFLAFGNRGNGSGVNY